MEVSLLDINSVSKAFGKVVKRHKLLHLYRNADIAEFADIADTYCSDLLNGKRNPSLFVVVSIAHAFNLTVSDLLKDFENLI